MLLTERLRQIVVRLIYECGSYISVRKSVQAVNNLQGKSYSLLLLSLNIFYVFKCVFIILSVFKDLKMLLKIP